jgi:hypothetical protein
MPQISSANGRTYLASIEKQERLRRVEDAVLRGVTNQTELASYFNVDSTTISGYMKEIKQSWLTQNEKDPATLRLLRIKQLEHIHGLALNTFENSQGEEVRTSVILKICDVCHGTGKISKIHVDEDDDEYNKHLDELHDDHSSECGYCSGRGKVPTEKITKTVNHGDPAFMKLAIDAIKEISKLEGNYPGSISLKKIQKTNEHGEIDSTLEEIYAEAPTDMIVEARAILDKLAQRTKKTIDQIKITKPDQDVLGSNGQELDEP